FEVFDDGDVAVMYVRSRPVDDYPLVIKADGLAAGKGVVVATTPAEAEQALGTLGRLPGGAGERGVIEEFLRGTELPVLALADGTPALPLPAARDSRRLRTGNPGP